MLLEKYYLEHLSASSDKLFDSFSAVLFLVAL